MKTPDEFAEAMKERGVHPPKRPEGEFVVSAPKKTKPMNAWWPEVGTLDQAIKASNTGFWAAMIVTAVNAVVATISLVQHTTIGGVDANGYIDAGLFALAGWGIRRRSRVGAVAGLLLFLLEKVYQFTTQPNSIVGLSLAIALIVAFISGVRGNFAYYRLAPEGFVEDAKPIMVMGVNLRRPIVIWVTALLCVVVLYKLIMGWMGANVYLFALRAVLLVLASMTLYAILQRPAWGRIVVALFSLFIATLLAFAAAMSPAPSMAAKALIWAMLGGPAAIYLYAACLGKPVRNYFEKAAVNRGSAGEALTEASRTPLSVNGGPRTPGVH